MRADECLCASLDEVQRISDCAEVLPASLMIADANVNKLPCMMGLELLIRKKGAHEPRVGDRAEGPATARAQKARAVLDGALPSAFWLDLFAIDPRSLPRSAPRAACAVPPVPEALVVRGGCAFIGIMSSVCRSDDLEIKLKEIMKSIVEEKEREVKV